MGNVLHRYVGVDARSQEKTARCLSEHLDEFLVKLLHCCCCFENELNQSYSSSSTPKQTHRSHAWRFQRSSSRHCCTGRCSRRSRSSGRFRCGTNRRHPPSSERAPVSKEGYKESGKAGDNCIVVRTRCSLTCNGQTNPDKKKVRSS